MVEERSEPIRSGSCKQIVNPIITTSLTDNPIEARMIVMTKFRALRKPYKTVFHLEDLDEKDTIPVDPVIECEIVLNIGELLQLMHQVIKMGKWIEKYRPDEYKKWADMVGEDLKWK